jgi:leader peptidase (prepilin peptidase)/N-methyltransferase
MTWTHHAIVLGTLFVLGSVIGSFLNVCIYRIPTRRSLWPSSRCPRCQGLIRLRDNVPILGWLILGGKCHRCASPISVRYPAVEALMGLLFGVFYIVQSAIYGRQPHLDCVSGLLVPLAVAMGVTSVLVTVAFIAWDTRDASFNRSRAGASSEAGRCGLPPRPHG